MDSAPYHNMHVNKALSSNSRKGDIIKWLIDNNIQHDASHTRAELLQLVKQHKHNLLRYEIDDLAVANGHKVLRLSPNYCQFNPIELIWAQVKDKIKRKNSNSEQQLVLQAIDNITPGNWKKYIDHTKKIEEDYRRKDIALEHLLNSFCIQLTESDFSSDENDEI